MRVLKFGGTSVQTPENILKVKAIVEGDKENRIVVVSAFGGVTDSIINTCRLASKGDDNYKIDLQNLENRHLETVNQLIRTRETSSILAQVKFLLNELEDYLYGVYLVKDFTPKTLDYILSFGERLSAYIISKTIENAIFVDSRQIIKTNSNYGKASIIYELTNDLVQKKLKNLEQIAVVPGFIASNEAGETTTLGRGGSDFTASILAAALDADKLEIWTDVSGFMNADPRKVTKAYPIHHMTYAEAMELSHFGAKVIYTPTIEPVYHKNIPIEIKNTFSPENVGTLITANKNAIPVRQITGISSIDDITLITIQGSGLVGVTGISMRLFRSLAAANVNIILISQASSEYTITFAVNPADAQKAKASMEEEFTTELNFYKSISIEIELGLSIIAIVGENMRKTPGISANLFNSLGRNGINIVAIAQGSSELNISIVVNKIGLKKALNVIHEAFFLSDYHEVHLYMAGIGTVGGKLISQIHAQQEKLLKTHRLKINVSGISNSRKMIFNEDGIDLGAYKALLEEGESANLRQFVACIKELNLRNSIFIDCTASQETTDLYPEVLDMFISIVSANKIACSSEYQLYERLINSAKLRNVKFLYETNVGAGLPILRTISDLVKSGDKIIKLQAVLSGTLNFIFNVLSPEITMSKAIKMAQEKGYSEPDPRIDLSGLDVLRKLLILCRESGYVIEKEDIEIHSFLPEECQATKSLEEFWSLIPKYDAEFESKRKALEDQGKKWRFVAQMQEGSASISLQEVEQNHPLYNLQGSDNIVLITTERYKDQPMIIKGAGAGADVTATGVFADIIRIANI